MTPHGPWTITGTREVHRDPWVRLSVDDVIRPDGKPGTFTVVRITPGVSVLPLDADGFVYLNEEFRYAVGDVSLEVTSGGREDGEDPTGAARRELKEELGIEADDWVDLGRVNPFTSMVLSPVQMFLARSLRTGPPRREGTELIRRVRVPLAGAVGAVMGGRITHAVSCVLILKAARWLETGGGA